MQSAHQYDSCLVLAGGGFRFGYYLGVHAAAEDSGHAPDVLLASCGGALAAAAIARLPDAAARKAWLQSPELFAFLARLGSTARAAPLSVLAAAAWRWLDRSAVPRVPDLFDDYLFELSSPLPLPPPGTSDTVAVAIVGGRLLFEPGDVGRPRGDRALFAETVFGNERVAALLDDMEAPAADSRWSSGAVAAQLETDSTMPLEDAVRISLADMVYFRCHTYDSRHYTGGVIDLFPVEIAQRLARRVAMERKPPLNPWLMAPAWRRVLGIDGPARLRHVHAQPLDAWIDTSDVGQALREHGMRKAIFWRDNRVRLVAPASYGAYRVQTEAQWQYGYQRALAAFHQEDRPCAS
ncbi:patatin-like phospholipase [Pseudoduganella lurida]|uniref:Patatin-like phospholipase n=1 Tax=Pseudoduganella lurida TaxID=1036180 RepID=A0A562QXE1_9BURK|nr:patatin-like phospholipase family protein [Pseudoduganella lurida]TWI61447.1 patatin-like phospholipase [Pseudoduganella lurida]